MENKLDFESLGFILKSEKGSRKVWVRLIGDYWGIEVSITRNECCTVRELLSETFQPEIISRQIVETQEQLEYLLKFNGRIGRQFDYKTLEVA